MSEPTEDGGLAPETADAAGDAREVVLDVDRIDTYYGQSHVLNGVSLSVGRSEIVTLVGRNGAGKSTTLRSIIGLTPPRSGTITLHGEEIQGLDPHEVRRRGVSWVPEDRRVFPHLSVEQNVDIAAGDDDPESVYERFPRLDERRGQRAGTLSGGEQQMLAIARAIVGPPIEVLLMDEPSEGLAPSIVEDVRAIIENLHAEGATILLVEQNAELALELADRAYVIEKGTIVHESAADELLSDREVMEQYLGVQ